MVLSIGNCVDYLLFAFFGSFPTVLTLLCASDASSLYMVLLGLQCLLDSGQVQTVEALAKIEGWEKREPRIPPHAPPHCLAVAVSLYESYSSYQTTWPHLKLQLSHIVVTTWCLCSFGLRVSALPSSVGSLHPEFLRQTPFLKLSANTLFQIAICPLQEMALQDTLVIKRVSR